MLTTKSPLSSFRRIRKNLSVKLEYATKRNQRLSVMKLKDALLICNTIIQSGATKTNIQELHNACANDEVTKCFGFVNICYE